MKKLLWNMKRCKKRNSFSLCKVQFLGSTTSSQKHDEGHQISSVNNPPPRQVVVRIFPFRHSELEFGSSPVTPLGIVTDRVSGSHTDPLWNRPILLLLFGQHLFDLQRLMRGHFSLNELSLLN